MAAGFPLWEKCAVSLAPHITRRPGCQGQACDGVGFPEGALTVARRSVERAHGSALGIGGQGLKSGLHGC